MQRWFADFATEAITSEVLSKYIWASRWLSFDRYDLLYLRYGVANFSLDAKFERGFGAWAADARPQQADGHHPFRRDINQLNIAAIPLNAGAQRGKHPLNPLVNSGGGGVAPEE